MEKAILVLDQRSILEIRCKKFNQCLTILQKLMLKMMKKKKDHNLIL